MIYWWLTYFDPTVEQTRVNYYQERTLLIRTANIVPLKHEMDAVEGKMPEGSQLLRMHRWCRENRLRSY